MADPKKKEQERIKVQLMILAVMLVLVVVVNRKRFFGDSSTQLGAARATEAASANRPTGPATVAQAASPVPVAGASRPSLTPDMIPVLTPEVVQKIAQRVAGESLGTDELTAAEISQNTVNPFTSFEADQEAYLKKRREAAGGAAEPVADRARTPVSTGQGAVIPRELLAFRAYGVLTLDGVKQAIIKQEGKVVPYSLRDGEPLEGAAGNYVVVITGDNRVWVRDLDAPGEPTYELGTGMPRKVSATGPQGGAPAVASTLRPGRPLEPVAVYLDDVFE